MFDFKERVLDPLASKTLGDINTALKTKNITDRIENLLSVQDELDTSRAEIAVKEASIGAGVGFSVVLVAAVFLACSPSIVAGLALVGGLGFFCRKFYNGGAACDVQHDIDDKIDTQVRALATAYPALAIESPRFQKELKRRFNLASADEGDLAPLRALLPQTPAPVRETATESTRLPRRPGAVTR